MMTHHWQGGLRRKGQQRQRRGGSWRRWRPGCCWWRLWKRTRLRERRRSTELLPPRSTSPNHPPLYSPLPAKHKAFFCKFPQKQVVKKEKKEGDRYIPTLCLFSYKVVSSPPSSYQTWRLAYFLGVHLQNIPSCQTLQNKKLKIVFLVSPFFIFLGFL